MLDENYRKREIDAKFEELQDSLNRIEVQTTRHNGRLTRVEKYMYTCMGAITILGFLMGAKLLTFIK